MASVRNEVAAVGGEVTAIEVAGVVVRGMVVVSKTVDNAVVSEVITVAAAVVVAIAFDDVRHPSASVPRPENNVNNMVTRYICYST